MRQRPADDGRIVLAFGDAVETAEDKIAAPTPKTIASAPMRARIRMGLLQSLPIGGLGTGTPNATI